MGQVTSRVSDDLEASLTGWAAEEGLQRADLIRRILGEAVDARNEGRAMFDRSDELGPADVAAMKRMLDQGVMEIDRIARTWAAHEVKIRKLESDDQQALARARAEFVSGLPDGIRRSLDPIRKDVKALAELIENLPLLRAVQAKLDALESERTSPMVTNYNIGLGDWSLGTLLSLGSILLVVGMFSFLALAAILPERWIALRTANNMLGGGERAICRLVDFHYGTGLAGCHTEVSGRTVTITGSPSKASRR